MEYAPPLLVSEAPDSHKRTRERSARDIPGNQKLLQKYGVETGNSKRLPTSSFRAHQETSGILESIIRKKRAQPLDYVMVNRLEVSDQCQSNGRNSKYS